MTALCRTASGRFTLAQALPIDAITSPMSAAARLIPAAQALGLQAITVAADRLRDVLDGRELDASALAPGLFQVLGDDGRVLAICERVGETMRYHRVLEPPRSR